MTEKNKLAPNFTLTGTDGEIYSLHETLHAGHHVLLVFLRHLG